MKKMPSMPDFPLMEREIMEKWEKKGILKKYLLRNKGSKKCFSFLDGPITANNPMGVHHGWGRTYKDLWQRFFNMRGYEQRFQNGFDCQGLWVEVEVEKELGIKNKKDIENLIPGNRQKSIAKFVDLCKERVIKYSEIQTNQSRRLGYFMDWDNSYFTMSDDNNYMIWHFLKKAHENGWIYKGRDSVPWCPRCETAISQHEMLTEDYKELVHDTVFFKLPVEGRDFSLLAWTTTPWTIPANVALAVNPDYNYAVYKNRENGEKIIILAKESLPDKEDKLEEEKDRKFLDEALGQAELWQQFDKIKGKDLKGLRYRGPFDSLDRVIKAQKENPRTFHTVVLAEDLVVATKGTGILHVAPGAGPEDFKLAKKENLPLIEVIGDNADYLSGMGEFSGKNAKNEPGIIIGYFKLQKPEYFHKVYRFKHRYPACWRCKTELVWKVTDEWYIAMDKEGKIGNHKGKTLRQIMMATAKKIKWMPAFGLERELDWLSNMHDWLISKKNRYWGLALPIYECRTCGQFEVIGSLEELEKRAISGWNIFKGKTPHKPWIDEVKLACSKCLKPTGRIEDVGNPWLDAGIVSFSTYKDPQSGKVSYTNDRKYWQKWFPADFITESFPGQFKNWFYSLIAMSSVLEGTNPFKRVLGFATLLGEDGRPMHKSWGNSIEFNEAADKIGVDVMRWIYVSQNPTDNLLFGYKKADLYRARFHLKLVNSLNYFIQYSLQEGWRLESARKNGISAKENVIDFWILTRLKETVNKATWFYENFNIKEISQVIEKFIDDLSVWYIRRIRGRLSEITDDKSEKFEVFNTLYEVLRKITLVIAPIQPFLSEMIYECLDLEGESVHLQDWPETVEISDEELTIIAGMATVREVCEAGHSLRREQKVKVRQPLRKLTVISKSNSVKAVVQNKSLCDLIKDELNVKDIEFKSAKDEMILEYDFNIDDKLRAEGQARDIIRMIQSERKAQGLGINDKVKVTLTDYPEDFKDFIMKKTNCVRIQKGEQFFLSK